MSAPETKATPAAAATPAPAVSAVSVADKQLEIYRAAVRIWCMRGETKTQLDAIDAANEIWEKVRKRLGG